MCGYAKEGSETTLPTLAGSHSPLESLMRQRATLPHPLECSTIAVPGLSFQVRNGGWASPRGYDHRKIIFTYQKFFLILQVDCKKTGQWTRLRYRFNFLDSCERSFPCYPNVLQTDRKECIALQRLVRVSSTPHRASTSRLSSTSSLCRFPNIQVHGTLILENASRLDAFSGYRIRT